MSGTPIKIAIVGSDGLPARYGGFETLVDQLSRSEIPSDLLVTVYTSSRGRGRIASLPAAHHGVRLVHLPIPANGTASILYDVASMASGIGRFDHLLVLGVSGCLFLPLFKPFYRTVSVHVDGLEWMRGKWGRLQRMVLRISEWVAIHTADHVIADNQAIMDHVREIDGGCDVHLIEYGGDQVIATGASSPPPGLPGEYAVTVCRIEPENNVHMILEAFQDSHVPIVIVGNWDRSEYGRRLRSMYSNSDRHLLFDPVYDQARLDAIRSGASIYVHGHSAGGTNPSLVEAMYLGLPVVAFDAPFNRCTTEQRAEYFEDARGLSAILARLSDSERMLLARSMREVAIRRYTWKSISSAYWDLLSGTRDEGSRRTSPSASIPLDAGKEDPI